VLIPISTDQPRNAKRCTELGVARSLELAAVTPEAVREAVLSVIEDAGYRRRAEGLRDELTALPGPEDAVGLLERLAVEKQPLLPA
jgi:UDP:flavonoid glycosyltransferase YjiC (YdhE family)